MSQETSETQTKKARIKMSSVTPALATPELQMEVQRLMSIQTQSLVPEPNLPLTILQAADNERARSIRPTSFLDQEAASQQGETTSQPEEGSRVADPEAEGGEDVGLPATQPYDDGEQRSTPGGGSQPTEQLDSQVQ